MVPKDVHVVSWKSHRIYLLCMAQGTLHIMGWRGCSSQMGQMESTRALKEATRSELAVMVETDHGMIERD